MTEAHLSPQSKPGDTRNRLCGCIARSGPHGANRGGFAFWRGRFPICGERGLLEPSRGRVPFARRVLPAEKEKAVDSQLIPLVWKTEDFLLASDFPGGAEQNFFFSAGKYLGGEVRRGGRPGCCQPGSPFLAQVLLYKTCPAKGRTTSLERGPLGSAHVTGQFI